MVDFSALLKKPSGEAKKPEALPEDIYPGIIKSFELGDANKNKTPYVRFHLALNGEGLGEGSYDNLAAAGIDLAKRQFRRDFYLTEDALWRLDDLLKGLGIEPGKSYEEALPEAVGKAVQVQIQRIIGQQDGAVMNTVGLLTPAE